MFDSNNSYFRIVAHNTNTMKVRIVTDTYNLQDEALSFLDVDIQPMGIVQPDVQTPQLEVIVTDVQHTMMFNGDQVHIVNKFQ